MATSPMCLYSEGEKILCYHGPLVYEAKCMKYRLNDENTYEYLVHYQGWNKNWDEWVPDSRILKYNDENLAKQKELLQQQKENKKKKGAGSKTPKAAVKEAKNSDVKSEGSVHDPDSRSSTPSVEGKLRGKNKGKTKESSPMPVQTVTESTEATILVPDIKIEDVKSEEFLPVPEIAEEPFVRPPKLPRLLKMEDINYKKDVILSDPDSAVLEIPDELNLWAVDDNYHINQLKRLVNLPAERTVQFVLRQFELHKIAAQPDSNNEEIHKMVLQIEDYFNLCLGSFLLYRCERPQYMDVLEQYPGNQLSQIYGVHHLLRLFQKSKMLLQRLPADPMKEVIKNFSEVLNFLVQNEKQFFFTSDYGIATTEYHRRCM